VLPPELSGRRRRSLFEGVRDAAAAAGCAVIGGDVAVANGPLVLTVTALGHLRQPPLRRDGARPGDALHTTGPLGGAALGHHLRFRPQLAEGAWLGRQPNVSAAIDVSDGLLLDLATVLRASGGLGAEVWAEHVPISRAARRLARRSGRYPLQHALGDGEDHVLLFTVRGPRPLRRGGPLEPATRRPFGRVIAQPGLHLVDAQGTAREVQPVGYQHQL
jgi:thiamine-monophosphate kinase